MKKRLRRLQLQRETLRNLTPTHLEAADGASTTILIDPFETYWNSCNPTDLGSRPVSLCNSCQATLC